MAICDSSVHSSLLSLQFSPLVRRSNAAFTQPARVNRTFVHTHAPWKYTEIWSFKNVITDFRSLSHGAFTHIVCDVWNVFSVCFERFHHLPFWQASTLCMNIDNNVSNANRKLQFKQQSSWLVFRRYPGTVLVGIYKIFIECYCEFPPLCAAAAAGKVPWIMPRPLLAILYPLF